MDLDGALDLANSGVPDLQSIEGGYRAHTTLDMWLVEVGSQQVLWDSLVIALGVGVMGTLDAHTSISSVHGAPTSPLALALAVGATDTALKTYGYAPMLTLRLGFDFFAIPRMRGQ